jgi:hypothetical protein
MNENILIPHPLNGCSGRGRQSARLLRGGPAASLFSAGVNVPHSTVAPGVKWRRRTAGDFSGMLPKYHRIRFAGLLVFDLLPLA